MAEPALAYDAPPCPALDAILALDEDSLPHTDDQPMPDVRAQAGPLNYSRDCIRRHLRPLRDHVSVDGDMFVYYIRRDERGQPARASVAPDVFVVFGEADRADRRVYRLWAPGAELRFVLEIASSSTRENDHTTKRTVYASLGVREYFLYDPPEEGQRTALLGLRLRGGNYERIPAETLPDGSLGVRSDVVGLVARIDAEGALRWFDPAAGRDLKTYDEAEDAREAAEARVAELEALLRTRKPRPGP